MKTRSKKLDEKELFLYYCESENGRQRNYLDVAKKFGLTKGTVEYLGKKNDWVNIRQKLGEDKFLCFKENREQIIAEAEQKQYQIWSKALKMLEWEMDLIQKKQESYQVAIAMDPTGKLARKVGAFDQRQLMEAMKTAINGFRINLGLPTEISKGEMTNLNKEVDLTDEDIAGLDETLKRLEKTKDETKASTTN
jgi:vacuolar-type H+-ATPase subunit H